MYVRRVNADSTQLSLLTYLLLPRQHPSRFPKGRISFFFPPPREISPSPLHLCWPCICDAQPVNTAFCRSASKPLESCRWNTRSDTAVQVPACVQLNLKPYTEMDLVCVYAGKNSCCSNPSESPKKNSSHEDDRYLAVAGRTRPKDYRLHAPCIKKMTLTSCEEVICRKYCSLCGVCCTSWLRKLFCTGVNPLVVHLLCLV